MSLADELKRRIESEGPLGIDDWMAACNAHYYAAGETIGAEGDFITAPEISQMFGELLGAALADCWRRAGAPDDAVYAELGPGRGTLARDAFRVMLGAGFAGQAHLVETSPAMRERQRDLLGDVHFHDDLSSLPEAPLLAVANEFFDALPSRQFEGEVERLVRLDSIGGFAFTTSIVDREEAPARDAAMQVLARHLAAHGGAALVIDYGHIEGAGDTLQAVRRHGFADPLADPGEQDLTTHVDFGRLAQVAEDAGCLVSRSIAQGSWLEALGIGARASALAAANPERTDEIAKQRRRLCDEEQMGTLFKAMAVHNPDWPCPAGFPA